MKRILVLLTLLSMGGAASAATIANWRFEEGTDGVSWSGAQDNHYLDSSGNENHLSAWTNDQNPVAKSNLPFVDQGGTTNTLALDFNETWQDNIGTWGVGGINDKAIDSHAFANGFTVEATFKTEDYDPWPCIVGKGGYLNPGVDGEQTLRMLIRSDNHTLECGFMDGATNWVTIQSLEALHTDRWYSAAMTFDPATTNFSFYLKQEDGGDYVLQGSRTDVVDGTSLGVETNFWKVGAGWWENNPVNYFFDGLIDEVKISDTALSTSEFVNQDGFTIPFDIEKPHSLAQEGFEDWDIDFDLIASKYWGPAGYAFTSSVWQISTDNTFASVDWQGTTGAVETITVPANALSDGNTYYARVQYLTDGGASAWSDAKELKLFPPETIAWWRFEKATGMFADSSGNGNLLQNTADPRTNPSLTDEIPYATEMPDNQTTNTSALLNPWSSELEVVDGAMLNQYAFTNGWTFEATFKTKESEAWHSLLCLQGKPNGAQPQTPFSFKQFPRTWGMPIETLWFKDDLNFDWVQTSPMELGKWYTIVATYDNEWFRLFLKGEGEEDFVLQGELYRTEGSSMDWAGVGKWVIGRGMWDNGANDWYNGVIDEIRISHGALAPKNFIHQSSAAAIMPPSRVNLVTFNGFDAPIRLGGSEFLCNGYAHESSEWQIFEGANVVWESGEIPGSTMLDLPPNTLASSAYSAHVRYKASDGTWSDWSETTALDYTTMAHWKFEDGTLGDLMATSEDSSLFGNTLEQPFGPTWMPTATNHVAFPTIPSTWEDNILGFYGPKASGLLSNPASDISVNTFPNGWTIEITFKADVEGEWQGVMGKDGVGAGDFPPFFMKLVNHDAVDDWSGNHYKGLEVGCLDDTDFPYSILTRSTMLPGVSAIQAGQWYSAAATYDNQTFRFYLKGEGDNAYVLQGSRNMHQGASFTGFEGKIWSLGVITWAGTLAADQFGGFIDEVKISSIALEPGGFIADIGAGWDSDDDGMADSWEIFYFGSIAASPGDNFDGDDRDNLTEYRGGGDPTVSDLGHAPSTGAVDVGGGTNAFEYVYARRKFPYSGDTHRLETIDDLTLGTWTNDGSVVISGIGSIDVEFDAVTNQVPMDTDEKFIKLIIE